MKKRLLATLLSLCLVVGLLPVTAMAADGDTEGGNATQIEKITIKGAGTQASPYQLTSAEQLKAFAEGTLVNSESAPVGTDYNDMYFHIAKQIDATDITIENPIYTAEHPFSGTIHFTSYTYSLSRDDVTTEYQRSFPVKSTSALMVVSSDGTAKGMPANLFQTFVSGSGTQNDPYLIKSAEQLSAMSGYLSAGSADKTLDSYCNLLDASGTRISTNSYFRIDSDIDMDGYNFCGLGANHFQTGTTYGPGWTTYHLNFSGKIDGGNHTISNLTHVRPDSQMAGFLTRASGAEIKDLTLDHFTAVYLGGTAPMGKVVGDSRFSNVHLTNYKGITPHSGYTSNAHADAAFIGQAMDTVIENCSSEGSIQLRSVGSGAGGFMGVVENCTLKNCSLTVDVTDTKLVGGHYTGLMFGYILDTSDIQDCTLKIGTTGTDTFIMPGGNNESILACSIAPNSSIRNFSIQGNFVVPNSTYMVSKLAGVVDGLTLTGDLKVQPGRTASVIIGDALYYGTSAWGGIAVSHNGQLRNFSWTGNLLSSQDDTEIKKSLWAPYVHFIDTRVGCTEVNASSGTAEIPLPPVGYHYGSDQWLIDDETNWDGSVSVSNTNTLKLTNCSVPNTYTINFVGGEGATGTTASVNATYDTPTTLTDNGFTKSGYKFAGWDTDAIADEVVYSNGSQVLNLTSEQEGTVPLYAVWTAKENVPAPNVTAETKTYNGQDQSLELSGFTVKYTQDGQEATPVDVGTYDLEIIKDETNDTAAYHSYLYAALTIEPAELIVAAEDKSMYVNDPLPVFTCTISGWQGDDGKNVAMPDPQATCSANGKTAGTYDIIPGHINAGDNYKVIYEKGKLTVSKHSSSNTTTSNTTTSTTNNPDGSTTTTTTDKTTGTVTETTKAADGTTVVATTDKQGNTTVTANVPAAAVDAAKGEAVALPTTVSAGESVKITAAKETKVEIPVENVTPGTVAVIVKADGTEEILKTSLPTEDGVVLTVEGDATVKIVDNAKEFVDVNPVNHWAEDAIDFVTAREMFTGTSETTFSPDVPMTRAQLMTVLARFDGQDTNGGATWYEKGMEWAKANGVSDGSNPSGSITREQLATMLWRYSGSPVVEGSMDHFTDAEAVSDYAADAMRWAVETGLISGVDNNTLDPQGNATRAQLATILMRFCQNLAE